MTAANEDSGTTAINLCDLLRRYMLHVADCEGITFVDRLNNDSVSDARFSDEEVGLLRKISYMIDAYGK